ncbi:MAG: hypothetical protein V1913_02470 [Fibrobacterota bacterium]
MISHIRTFPDGARLAFGKGRFDPWCVYLKRPDKKWYAPRDRQYFSTLKKIAKKHGTEKLYRDFIVVYDTTGKSFVPAVLARIEHMAGDYGKEAGLVDLWFTVLYAGMVAEENKKSAVLKKRIKRLGVHQLLAEGMAPDKAAAFSRGKEAWMLDLLCRRRGF